MPAYQRLCAPRFAGWPHRVDGHWHAHGEKARRALRPRDLRVEGLDGMVAILELLMRGDTWVEIGEPEKRRFYRVRRKKFTASGTFTQGTKTC